MTIQALGQGAGVGVGEFEAVGDGDGEALAVGDGEGDGLADGEGDALGEADGVGEEEADGEGVAAQPLKVWLLLGRLRVCAALGAQVKSAGLLPVPWRWSEVPGEVALVSDTPMSVVVAPMAGPLVATRVPSQLRNS